MVKTVEITTSTACEGHKLDCVFWISKRILNPLVPIDLDLGFEASLDSSVILGGWHARMECGERRGFETRRREEKQD